MIGTTDGPSPSPAGGLRQRSLRLLLDVIVVAIVAAVTVWMLNAFLITRFRVEGESMFPALRSGDFVLVDRIVYQVGGLQRGDVIVFQYPYGPERDFIKRVIALPGDGVSIADGLVRVNGVPLDEPYIAVPAAYTTSTTLGPDQIFVLGDNRNNSVDSHTWGPLDRGFVVGRAIAVYWPPAEAGIVVHYAHPEIPNREVVP